MGISRNGVKVGAAKAVYTSNSFSAHWSSSEQGKSKLNIASLHPIIFEKKEIKEESLLSKG